MDQNLTNYYKLGTEAYLIHRFWKQRLVFEIPDLQILFLG